MSTPSKKRKHANDDDAAARKAKKARKHKEKRARRDAEHAHEFAQVEASLVIALPPVFAAAPAQGVEEMLDSMLMRYIPPLRGVVLAHENMRFLDSTAEITGDSPFASCRIAFGATVWSPRVGQQLTGHITVSSPDHVALLVHRTFNAAIPAAHVPRDEWEFVPGAADEEEDEQADVDMAEAEVAGDEHVAEDGVTSHARTGHWVHAVTREPLGGPNRTLTFTVIGLTIANQMLSVVGSIQPDPFAPIPVALAQDAAEVELALEPAPADEPESEPDFDLFAALGRKTDATTERKEKKKRKKDVGADDEKPRKKSKDKEKRKRKQVEGGHKEEP